METETLHNTWDEPMGTQGSYDCKYSYHNCAYISYSNMNFMNSK